MVLDSAASLLAAVVPLLSVVLAALVPELDVESSAASLLAVELLSGVRLDLVVESSANLPPAVVLELVVVVESSAALLLPVVLLTSCCVFFSSTELAVVVLRFVVVVAAVAVAAAPVVEIAANLAQFGLTIAATKAPAIRFP